MPVRMPRGISARVVGDGDVKVIAKRNLYTGEDLGRIGGPIHIASLPASAGDDDSFAFVGPAGLLEVNTVALFIPSEVINTFSVKANAVPKPPQSADEWDTLARRLLLEFGTDGNEYYGANPDDRATFDAVRNVWFRNRPGGTGDTRSADDDPASAANNNPAVGSTGVLDEPALMPGATMGPLGVIRFAPNEMLLSPTAVQGPTRNLAASVLGQIFGQSVGYTDLVHGASMAWQANGPIPNVPGSLLLVAYRYNVPTGQTLGFAGTYHDPATGSDDEDVTGDQGLSAAQHGQVNRALNELYGGDMERVQADLRYDNGFRGDWLRSELFGGDMFIEQPGSWATNFFGSDGLWGAAANQVYQTWLRPNDVLVATKWNSSILTPYTLRIS